MTTFALVQGGWHGAWCWERLIPLLQQAGHDVVTMDLPNDDGSAAFDTYADVVCAALTGCDDDVVWGRLPSRLIPHRHRPRAELQPAHELQVDMLR
jgi:hypothetical protein